MRLYSANVYGNKAHKHGPPQVHAWAAMLHSVCKIKPEECDESCIVKLREHYMECSQNRERAISYLSRCQMKDGIYELVAKGGNKKEKKFSTSLFKLQVTPEARTLANAVKDLLIKYFKATEYHGPAPMAPMERQAQEKLDKMLKKNKKHE